MAPAERHRRGSSRHQPYLHRQQGERTPQHRESPTMERRSQDGSPKTSWSAAIGSIFPFGSSPAQDLDRDRNDTDESSDLSHAHRETPSGLLGVEKTPHEQKNQLERMTFETSALRTQLRTAEERAKIAESRARDAEDRSEALDKELRESHRKLNRERNRHTKSMYTRQKKVDNLARNLQAERTQIKTLRNENEELQKEIQDIIDDFHSEHTQTKALIGERRKLLEKVESFNNDLEAERARAAALEGEKGGLQRRIESLDHDLQKGRIQVEILIGEKAGLQKQIDNLIHELNVERAEFKALREEKDRLQKKVNDLAHYLQANSTQIKTLEDKKGSFEGEIGHTCPQLQTLRDELKSVKARARQQETQIREIQSRAFEGIGADSWKSGDDNTVRADIEKVHRLVKQWARKYASEDINATKGIPKIDKEALLAALRSVVRVRPAEYVAENDCLTAIDHLFMDPVSKKASFMCLEGLLAHFVYENVVGNPFHPLSARNTWLYAFRGLRNVNEAEAHLLRSKVIRLLNTSDTDNISAEGKRFIQYFKSRQQRTIKELTKLFIATSAKHLMRPAAVLDSKATDELEKLMASASALSLQLASRRTGLMLHDIKKLKDVEFSADSQVLRPHRLHRLHDEDDKRCDGWKVGIVTHPVVFGYGSSDGKNYGEDTERVWMKAEVWLCNKI